MKDTSNKPCEVCKAETKIVCMCCNKRFCNNFTNENQSHILLHHTKNDHNSVQIVKPLLCNICGSNNVFDLGYICNTTPIFEVTVREVIKCKTIDDYQLLETTNPTIHSELLCRFCCTADYNYISVFYDGCFTERVVSSFILQIKDCIGLQKQEEENKTNLPKVKLVYEPHEYKTINSILLNYEYDCNMMRAKAYYKKGVKVRFESRKEFIRKFLREEDFIETTNYYLLLDSSKMMQSGHSGGIVNLVSKTSSIYGVIMNHSVPNEIKVKICKVSGNINPNATYVYNYNPFPCSKERMFLGLERLGRLDHELAQNIYGRRILEEYSIVKLLNPSDQILSKIPSLPKLNESQILAIKYAIEKKLVLIQGPPGSGKTITAAAIVYNLLKAGHCKNVLVVANNNTAVNNITEKIFTTGINVVRVLSHIKGCFDDDLSFISSHYLAKKAYYAKHEKSPENNDDMKKLTQKILIDYEKMVIRSAEVITTTSITAGKRIFSGCIFPVVIVDEATQSTEPINLIPLIHGCKKLILIGDHRQLGPYSMNENLAGTGFDQTLFQRFINLQYSPVLLDKQYRMHPVISYLPNILFYNNRLKDGISCDDREQSLNLPFPSFFYACFGREEIFSNGVSCINQMEANQCFELVKYMIDAGVKERNIGIITAYEGQRNLLLRKLSALNLEMLEIKNVDAYQGREKDYIILCTVRSNSKQGVGFLSDTRRINVSLTRGRFGLAIIGNPYTLCTDKTWYKIVKYYNDNNMLYAGNINQLKLIKLQIN